MAPKEIKPRKGIARLTPLMGPVLGAVFIFGLLKLEAFVCGPAGGVLVVGSIGASAVLVFLFPESRFSLFRSVVFGHVISAAIGVACAARIPDEPVAAACAVGGAMLAMRTLDCVHPPGGATALAAVIGGAGVHALGFRYVFNPVFINAILLALIGVVLRRIRHPHHPQSS